MSKQPSPRQPWRFSSMFDLGPDWEGAIGQAADLAVRDLENRVRQSVVIPEDTLPFRLHRQATRSPARPALRHWTAQGWTSISWAELEEHVLEVAAALLADGFASGDRLGILSANRPEWVMSTFAAMCAGGSAVGLDPTWSPDRLEHVLRHSGLRILVVEDMDQWAKVRAVRHRCPQLSTVVLLEGSVHDARAVSWTEFVQRGRSVDRWDVEACRDRVAADERAALLYPSETAGKAVELTHRDLTQAAAESALCDHDIWLSCRPLSEFAEQGYVLCGAVTQGYEVVFVRPEMVEGVQQALSSGPRWSQLLFSWAHRIGAEAGRRRADGQPLGALQRVQLRVADWLVLAGIRRRLGLRRAHLSVTSHAPLAQPVSDFFVGHLCSPRRCRWRGRASPS